MSREITLEVERTWERRSEKSEKLVDSIKDLVQIKRISYVTFAKLQFLLEAISSHQFFGYCKPYTS